MIHERFSCNRRYVEAIGYGARCSPFDNTQGRELVERPKGDAGLVKREARVSWYLHT